MTGDTIMKIGSYDEDSDDYNESAYLKMIDEERDELEALKEASTKKHDYREITFSKEDVADVEKKAMRELLEINRDLAGYSDAFIQKALVYFPELALEMPAKKKRGKKSNMYFLEPVGRHLWEKWSADRSAENQNDFVTYLFTIIDGVIFKYGRHKHGLSYGEVFQGAVIKLIQAMDKFDPKRQVGTDERGNPIYARVYTYFTMILNYGITTITMAHGGEKIKNVSYEAISRTHGVDDKITDASLIFQDFMMFLNSFRTYEDLTPTQSLVLNRLYEMLVGETNLGGLSNNLIYTLQTDCGVRAKDVLDAMQYLRREFGPLNIFSEKTSFNNVNSDETY